MVISDFFYTVGAWSKQSGKKWGGADLVLKLYLHSTRSYNSMEIVLSKVTFYQHLCGIKEVSAFLILCRVTWREQVGKDWEASLSVWSLVPWIDSDACFSA